MKSKLYNFIIIILLVSLYSCNNTNEWHSGDYFFLKNKSAVMPIWVTGNIDSNIFIITNHDGPGNTSGHDFHKSVGFKELEKKYAIVYWDQRMSGLSQGDPMYNELTIDLHVQDLQKLTTLITARYAPKALFMYGNGWGGGIALNYLGTGTNQKLFKGFINESGFIKDSLEQVWKKNWIIPRAEKKYDATQDSDWLTIINWYKNNPYPSEADSEPFEFVHQLEGYYFDESKTREINNLTGKDILVNSPYSFGWKTNQYTNRAFIANYDFEASAKKIALPTLLIWGKENGAVPVEASDYIYNLLATPTDKKDVIQLEECAHYPHLEKPNAWYEVVNDFIKTNL